MARRLPVYILLDTSGSMAGEPIEAVKVGLGSMVASLRQDPHALESVYLSLITFNAEVTTLVPLTPLEEFILPEITVPRSGPTLTVKALRAVLSAVGRDLIRSLPERKGDWRPLLFVMTDGAANDGGGGGSALDEVGAALRQAQFGTIVGCAAGPKARVDEMKRYCNHVVSLETMDGHAFQGFFKWVSTAVSSGNVSVGVSTEIPLPPAPPEMNLIC